MKSRKMLNKIIITQQNWTALKKHILQYHQERMAFAYGYINSINDQQKQFLIKNIDLPEDREYRQQNSGLVSLKVENVVSRIVKAKEYQIFIDCHSHPFAEYPTPSSIDLEGWQRQLQVFQDLAPDTRLISLIMGKSGQVWAAIYKDDTWKAITEIVILGEQKREVLIPVNSQQKSEILLQSFEKRSEAVLGKGCQQLRQLKVLVIGLGGVGSAVIAQLKGYLNHLILIDPDEVEIHNTPRLYGYQNGDEGKKKVEIISRNIEQSFPNIKVITLAEAFPSPNTLEAFKEADFIFCCPDHNAVRYAAAQAASRYCKPLIEVGCGGKCNEGKITALGYHIRLQVPGKVCLACNGMDLRDLEDPSTTTMKKEIGYIENGDLIQGELIPLTTRAASDAVDLFFRYITGYASVVSHLYFDALKWCMIDLSSVYQSHPSCPICGESSVFGFGDFVRDDLEILPFSEIFLDYC